MVRNDFKVLLSIDDEMMEYFIINKYHTEKDLGKSVWYVLYCSFMTKKFCSLKGYDRWLLWPEALVKKKNITKKKKKKNNAWSV